MGASINQGLVDTFVRYAEKFPARTALVYPTRTHALADITYEEVSYKQLHEGSNQYAHGLTRLGVIAGTRVLLLVRPGLDFISLTFSICKIGAVPVFIDPGMGLKALLKCIRDVQPEAMIAIPLAHVLTKLYPEYFKSVRLKISTGKSWLLGALDLADIRHSSKNNLDFVPPNDDDPFVIAFTTGSTGIPKGVVCQHRTMNAQILTIKRDLHLNEKDIVLEAFIPFALRDIAMGTTCILPNMNPTRPSEVDPRGVVSVIQTYRATFSFGSPAFWNSVASYCIKNQIKLSSLRNIMLAGAPVSSVVIRDLKSILHEHAEVHTPYGATEALPLTSICGKEIIEGTAELTDLGHGICVGSALHGVEIRIIKLTDEPIRQWSLDLVLDSCEIGEIVVKGAVVTNDYFNRPEQTAFAKIGDKDGRWHRMGDAGYLDDKNRLWYCGRKADRVVTKDQVLFTIPCEAIFNQHQDVSRSALIGIGGETNRRPVMVVEPHNRKMPRNEKERKKFIEKLQQIAQGSETTKGINDFLFHPRLPVDYRHNSKILRPQLTTWAERKML